jgi:opacity protein-like surface antigen
MKKSISILVLVALGAAASFAQEFNMSAGGGALFDLGIPMVNDVEDLGLTIGGFGFFDATYAEADVAFSYGLSTGGGGFYTLGLEFGVLGKYPFKLGSITLFPLLGVRYNLILAAGNEGGSSDNALDSSFLGFQAGAGIDYFFSDAIFFRGELLCNLDLVPFNADSDDIISSIGPRVKVGVGYKF